MTTSLSGVTRRRAVASMAATLSLACAAASGRAQTQARAAFVVGNASYPDKPLANALNDAWLVGAKLNELGFTIMAMLPNAGLERMLTEYKVWLAKAEHAAVRFVYFAGHGAQFRGRNYLIPVDAKLRSEDDLPATSFDVKELIEDRLSRIGSGVSIAVLDACRNTPTTANVPGARKRGPGEASPWSLGFAKRPAPQGTLIAYSTAPGALAADNPRDGNSVYTRHLVSNLDRPGLSIEGVFKKTREDVLRETQGTQVPHEDNRLVGRSFCFKAGAGGACGIDG